MLSNFIVILYLKAKYIAECLDEIKQELKSGDLQAKANAVGKLLYVSGITSSIDNIMCLSIFGMSLDINLL